MIQPDIPFNEINRLEVLCGLRILDTPAEERFDRLTRMAKHMFNVPIALVTLVDENRQWFKSCIGLEATEASRDISFCGHTILDSEVLVVPSASSDHRFIDNPFVIDVPNVEFYAGYPLVVGGYRLGTLCIADNRIRDFDDQDIAALKDLAATVEQELSALQMATHDELTGILNRRGFISLAQNSLNLSVRDGVTCTLVYLDLDDFKLINDNFGHEVGDKILHSFAAFLNRSFRDSDIVARLAGDEFVLLLNNASQQDAQKIMVNFKQSLLDHLQQSEMRCNVSFSMGFVEFNLNKHSSIDLLLSEADQQMYVCKGAKR
ncbi:sensor domain-containing diguanylate cyclase [Psychromonas sp. SR45-3]|uniref:sensor domain-containing diguanylate cyclase n=1 Tax=Psychromonas sp. SR45-3 TaxID=2760930 RepID=UPI0015F889E2|nr:sensor domain-containing diguanylate cyclase [Psychromonas sp. SR45-3]MBB1273237.1 sensor domain-containing diguanylate cyclase [Psychromonas sp. SR45-3]